MSNEKHKPDQKAQPQKQQPVLQTKPTISIPDKKASQSIETKQESEDTNQDSKLNSTQLSSSPRDLDRDRARDAWERIVEVKGKEYEGKYSSRARDLPAMIQVNGLAQTLSFLKAKGKEQEPKSRKEHLVKLFYHISSWACSRISWEDGNSEGTLLERILKTSDTQKYRQATSEVMAYAQWLKRFAEGELKSEEDQSK